MIDMGPRHRLNDAMHPFIRTRKRQWSRAPLDIECEVAVEAERFRARLKQISEGGLLLQSNEKLPARPFVVSFMLPGGGLLRVAAESRYQNQYGYGCQFTKITPELRAQIDAFLKRTKKLYSDIQFGMATQRPVAQLAPLLRQAGLDGVTEPKELKRRVSDAMDLLLSAGR